ncbi:MAG TPA: DAK2 domain-containing protein [Solirubrobacteraceae bacterium]|nr:DAK2 domain-containing protein [Solirubrobacteraceae bacterium]
MAGPGRATDRIGASDPSIVRFRAVLEAGLAALQARREEVNDLNVFPVADGDTGDNMVLTLRAVLEELDRLEQATEGRTIDEIGRDEIVASVARAALLGARGSSGVILSQLIRGAAEELASRPGELVDPVLIGAALARAADQAYGSVREPVEGTILTVVREMAHRVASEIAHRPDARLDEDATGAQQDAALAVVIERALAAGEESVSRGPDLLPALREAGVVDAGGYGLTVLLAGIVGALRSGEAPAPAPASQRAPRVNRPQHTSTTFRYCMSFVVCGAGLRRRDFVPELERIGDSVLVVGDSSTLRVHLHTDDPAAAADLFCGAGSVSRVEVADMRSQLTVRERRPAGEGQHAACGVLGIVAGDGLPAQPGARWLRCDPGRLPSVYELLAAIHELDCEEVVLICGEPGVLAAARRAAELSERPAVVVEARSPQAIVAGARAADPQAGAEPNARRIQELLAGLRTGGVRPAAADDPAGRFRAGDAIGDVDGELVGSGRPEDALAAVLERLGAGAELITVLCAEGAPLGDARVRELSRAGAGIELLRAGPAGAAHRGDPGGEAHPDDPGGEAHRADPGGEAHRADPGGDAHLEDARGPGSGPDAPVGGSGPDAPVGGSGPDAPVGGFGADARGDSTRVDAGCEPPQAGPARWWWLLSAH